MPVRAVERLLQVDAGIDLGLQAAGVGRPGHVEAALDRDICRRAVASLFELAVSMHHQGTWVEPVIILVRD